MFTLKSLHAAQLIVADHSLTLLCQFQGPLIQGIDVTNFLIGLVIRSRREPVPNQMGFKIALFLKDDQRDVARSFQQSDV